MDPDRMYRQRAAEQDRLVAQQARGAEAATAAQLADRRADIATTIPEVLAALEERGWEGGELIRVAKKYHKITGRTTFDHVAAWRLCTVTKDWKDMTVTYAYDLTSKGRIAGDFGGLGGFVYLEVDDVRLVDDLVPVLAGLRRLAGEQN